MIKNYTQKREVVLEVDDEAGGGCRQRRERNEESKKTARVKKEKRSTECNEKRPVIVQWS